MVVAHLVPNFIVIIVNRNYVFCSNPIFSVNDNNNDEVGDNEIKNIWGINSVAMPLRQQCN